MHSETGLLCDEHEVNVMASYMLQLLNDTDLAKQLGKKGKEHILKNYNLERHICVLQDLLTH